MRRTIPTLLHDRQLTLLSARDAAEAEVGRLAREEEFLAHQIREAQAQLRYHEDLLVDLRREWGKDPPLQKLFRRHD